MKTKLYLFIVPLFWQASLSSSNIKLRDEVQPMFSNDDEHYEEFVEYAYSRHLYHAYTFSSGVGNRERLAIGEVNLDPTMRLGEGVKEWIKLKLKEEYYLVGLCDKGFTVMNVKNQGNSSIFSEIKIDLDYSVETSAIFEYRNLITRKKEVILMVVINQGLYNCLWYRIQGTDMEKFWELPLLKKITSLKTFYHENNYHFLLANDHGNYGSSLEIFRIEFNNSVPFIWFLQLIPLKYTASSIAFTTVNADLYMSVVQNPLNMVIIYKYQPFCLETNEGKFVEYRDLTSENISVVNTFFLANQNYLLINGNQANIFLFNCNGEIEAVFDNKIGYVEDWLVIEVETYRDDIILLARNYAEINLITWGGSLDGFTVNTPHPSCYRINERQEKVSELSKDLMCLNIPSWKAAVSINVEDHPVIILTGPEYSQVYHFVYFLIPIMNPEWNILRVELFKNSLKKEWGILKQRYEDYGVGIEYDDGLEIESMKKRAKSGRYSEVINSTVEDWPSLFDLENLLLETSAYMNVLEKNLINCEDTLYSRNNSFHAYFEGKRRSISELTAGFFNSSFEGYLWFDEPLIMERRENETINFELTRNNNQIAANGMITFVVGQENNVLNEDGSKYVNNNQVGEFNSGKHQNVGRFGYSKGQGTPSFTPEIVGEKLFRQNTHMDSLGLVVNEGLNTNTQNLPHYYTLIDKG